MKKVLIITFTILVLIIGVVLTFALYGNSPFNKVKINDVYNEDKNNNVGSELGDNVKSYDEDDINNTVPKEIDNSDVAPSRIETSGDAVQPPNDSLCNTGDVNDSVNEDNDTGDNENNEEHKLESNIKLRADAKEILVSSGTETVCFRAETFIDADKILLIDANTVLPVATMVDDGRRSISG